MASRFKHREARERGREASSLDPKRGAQALLRGTRGLALTARPSPAPQLRRVIEGKEATGGSKRADAVTGPADELGFGRAGGDGGGGGGASSSSLSEGKS